MEIIFVSEIEFKKAFSEIPLGILSLATVCNCNKDIDAKVVDFGYLYESKRLIRKSSLSEDIDIMCKYILDLNPDIVSFYSLCSSYHLSIMLSKRLKLNNPNIIVFLGGPHASLTAKETLKSFGWIDYIGMDEGEETIVNLVKGAFLNSVESLDGIAYRMTGSDEILVSRAIECDLNKLPFIDYSLVDMTKLNSVPIDVGRGCPFKCIYCSTKTFWKQKFRIKSSERILEEIQLLINYGIRNFDFVHDLFTADKKLLIEFCDKLLETNLNITWSCSARLDTLNDDLLDLMYLAGCRKIYLGIETGSSRMQKIISKNLELDLIANLIEYINNYNIKFTCSFIYGFPEETEEDLRLTLNLIYKLWVSGIEVVQLHKVTYLPGTELFEQNKNNLVFDPQFGDFIDSSFIDDEALALIMNFMNIFPQYYSVPSIADEYQYLDIFIYYFFPTIYDFLPATFITLTEILGSDMLEFYKSFDNKMGGLLKKIKARGGEYIQTMYYKGHLFEWIEIYINLLFENNKAALELAKFEVDSYNFLSMKRTTMDKTYSYDVIDMRMNPKKSLFAEQCETRVRFNIKKSKIVNVSYI